jgi:hypothetical protein
VGVTYDYPIREGIEKDTGRPVVKAYEVTIKCYFEFMRRPDGDPFQQGEYERWATDLFGGLDRMIAG